MPAPSYDDRRTLNRWLIAATGALVVATAGLLFCVTTHL